MKPKPPEEMVQVSYRIPATTKERFRQYCLDTAHEPGKLLKKILEEFLDREQSEKPTTK
jgi:hypothetical protein